MRSFGPYPTTRNRPRTKRRLWVAPSSGPDPLDPNYWVPSPIVAQVPRRFCAPVEAFGTPNAPERTWLPPTDSNDPKDWSEFREAVLQHAIYIAVRRHKNDQGMTQERLASLDDRSNSQPRWNAMLNGRRLMSLEDIAFLLLHFPEALPTASDVSTLLAVAEKTTAPPADWAEVDR